VSQNLEYKKDTAHNDCFYYTDDGCLKDPECICIKNNEKNLDKVGYFRNMVVKPMLD